MNAEGKLSLYKLDVIPIHLTEAGQEVNFDEIYKVRLGLLNT